MAAAVTNAWQKALENLERVQSEVSVGDGLGERIDVVDFSNATAYEMKVSGKNAPHEFYRDVFKIWAYNRTQRPKLKRFVFISEPMGIERLAKGLPNAVIERAGDLLGISVELVSVTEPAAGHT